MATVNSQQKIDGFNAIVSNTTLFMLNLAELSKSFKSDADTIAVPAVSSTATGILGVIKSANELCMETGDTMKKILDTWGDRQGFGEAARAAFEDCKSNVAKIDAAQFTVPEVEPCDGLHETVTDETIAAFMKDIEELTNARYTYIMKISEIKDEFATEDTNEVYTNIGIGIEKFTNGIVSVLDVHKADLAKFGMNLDDSISKVKSQSAAISAAGESAKAKIANVEGDLD